MEIFLLLFSTILNIKRHRYRFGIGKFIRAIKTNNIVIKEKSIPVEMRKPRRQHGWWTQYGRY